MSKDIYKEIKELVLEATRKVLEDLQKERNEKART
jgi:hypothetical protein